MQLPGLNIGIIADDLTGANDTALPFLLSGCSTQVLLGLHATPTRTQTQVWSVNTDSRHANPHDAVASVRRAVALLKHQHGVENFYKKIDSTLRGHLVDECLAVLDELKWDCAVLAPAYPQEARRTVGGYQLVRGLPVEQTEVARDPLFPIRQSHVPTLLRQQLAAKGSPQRAEALVGHIELSTVLHGAGPIVRQLTTLIESGKKLVVADACSSTDLDQIALALEKIRKSHPVLPCGSAGLAQSLTRLWSCDLDAKPLDHALIPSPLLVVIGSNSDTTRVQVERLLTHYDDCGEDTAISLVQVSPEAILGLAPVDPYVQQVLEGLTGQNTVVLTSSFRPDNLPRTLSMAESMGLTAQKAAQMTQSTLARITETVLSQRAAKLILSGGDTAQHLCRAIGAQSLLLVAETEPSIPLALVPNGTEEALQSSLTSAYSPIEMQELQWVVTKSGNFGSPESLIHIVRYLKQRERYSLRV